ncbi:AMP nucleosidase [Brenneria rubrifaciens]|uniref:AMP nucleosidase n=1 Tax=Brenneria rubrifaciens TaxID=55213 RepID=A0A4P8QTI6_9GAMM|nr:AMP nucleosidase [Brenneria rubrifaciens]
MLPENVTIWQPERPALTLSKKTGAVHSRSSGG